MSVKAGIGLLGLAVYNFCQGDLAGGVQSVFAALAAFGVYSQNQLHLTLTDKLNRKGLV